MIGKLVVLEGTDGTGKATQSRLLRDYLTKSGAASISFSYPDYGSVYGKVIDDFLHGRKKLTPDEQFFVYILDMIKDISAVKEALGRGFVIMDRYLFSTLAYQCANGFEYDRAKKIIPLTGLQKPDLTLYIDVPVDVSMERKLKQKGTVDNFEKDRDLLTKVKKNYSIMMSEGFYSGSWARIDGSQGIEKVSEAILSELERKLGRV